MQAGFSFWNTVKGVIAAWSNTTIIATTNKWSSLFIEWDPKPIAIKVIIKIEKVSQVAIFLARRVFFSDGYAWCVSGKTDRNSKSSRRMGKYDRVPCKSVILPLFPVPPSCGTKSGAGNFARSKDTSFNAEYAEKEGKYPDGNMAFFILKLIFAGKYEEWEKTSLPSETIVIELVKSVHEATSVTL